MYLVRITYQLTGAALMHEAPSPTPPVVFLRGSAGPELRTRLRLPYLPPAWPRDPRPSSYFYSGLVTRLQRLPFASTGGLGPEP